MIHETDFLNIVSKFLFIISETRMNVCKLFTRPYTRLAGDGIRSLSLAGNMNVSNHISGL